MNKDHCQLYLMKTNILFCLTCPRTACSILRFRSSNGIILMRVILCNSTVPATIVNIVAKSLPLKWQQMNIKYKWMVSPASIVKEQCLSFSQIFRLPAFVTGQHNHVSKSRNEERRKWAGNHLWKSRAYIIFLANNSWLTAHHGIKLNVFQKWIEVHTNVANLETTCSYLARYLHIQHL